MGSIQGAACVLLLNVTSSLSGASGENSDSENSIARDVAKPARTYTTREERRDAGVKHEIADWLAVFGLAEVEYLYWDFDLRSLPGKSSADEFSKTVQFGAKIIPFPSAVGELIIEYDDDRNEIVLDEVVMAIEWGELEFETGYFYMPFGEYFSHFVSGPFLEFGETRDIGMSVNFGLRDNLDVSVYLYDGGEAEAASGGRWDLGFAVEGGAWGFATFGVSYLSDLGDSDEGLLADNGDIFESRVHGLSGYLAFGVGAVEITGEFAAALSGFEELEEDRNRPTAWNLEAAYFPEGSLAFAARIEGSSELEGAPRLQGGAACTWRITDHVFLTVEYLYGSFRESFLEDFDERDIESASGFGALLSVEF